jgi:DamX protein
MTTATAPKSAITMLKSGAIPQDPAQQIAWLWSQDPRHFTLQLFGTYQRDSVARFIKRYKLSGKAAMFTSQRNGRNWYVLVYGSYPDRNQAKQGIKGLPASLETSPWIRSFASIHEVLSAGQ